VATLVSVCIPSHNGARWLARSINSALAQTYGDIEVLVLDDASTDDSVRIANSFNDSRVRVMVNDVNLGLVRNWNRCITLSKGALTKFLFQDDLLYPGCVERMARIFDADPNVGMVFSPRDIILDNPNDPQALAWKERFGKLYTRFSGLHEVNPGRTLFNDWLKDRFSENWVGEPSCVMLRRSCLDKIGLFNTRMFQIADIEMWARLAYFYDVGFIPEPLSAFTFHSGSTSSLHVKRRFFHLDRLWLVEGLLAYEEIRRNYPQVKDLRVFEAKSGFKRQVGVGGKRGQGSTSILDRPQALTEYLAFRFLEMLRIAPKLHGEYRID